MSTQTVTLDRQIDGQPFPAVGTYTIDPAHSTIQATARHLMVTKVRGTFTSFAGTITVAERPEDSSVSVDIEAASIDTRSSDRDAHLRSGDFLDVETHASLTFASASVTRTDDGWAITGTLTIRGISREVTLATDYLGTFANPWGQSVAAFSAHTKINREDWGMTWNAPLEAGGVLVGKDLAIDLEIQAQLEG